MPKSRYQISDESLKVLMSFKKVVDAILEEDIDTTNYVDIVIDRGIKAMLSDIVPKDTDTLWKTIERISEVNPEFFFQFVVDALKQGGEINKAAAKEKLGFIKN